MKGWIGWLWKRRAMGSISFDWTAFMLRLPVSPTSRATTWTIITSLAHYCPCQTQACSSAWVHDNGAAVDQYGCGACATIFATAAAKRPGISLTVGAKGDQTLTLVDQITKGPAGRR